MPERALASDPDVLVIGFGPAGMAAAIRAADCGAHVLVIDDNYQPGGQIWRGGEHSHNDSQSRTWFARLKEHSIRVLRNTQLISASASRRSVLIETADRHREISFKAAIIATGARELFLPFPGWTLPGVTGAGGLQALVKSGLPIRGKRVVVGGSGPLLLAVAANLKKAGARVKLIAEQASRAAVTGFAVHLLRYPSKIAQAAALQSSLLGISYKFGCWIEAAEGDACLQRVRVRHGSKIWMEACDYAAIGYGLTLNLEVPALMGCSLEGTGVTVDKRQRTSVEQIYAAGECTGIGGVDLSLIEGEIAGYAAAGRNDLAGKLISQREKALQFAVALNASFSLRPELRALAQPDTLVCRCEDVTRERLQKLSSLRAAKLHTRCGMGPCQGRICGPAAQFLFGWGSDTLRPPIFPARVGSLASDQLIPEETLENAL